jgi:hypothetical protein
MARKRPSISSVSSEPSSTRRSRTPVTPAGSWPRISSTTHGVRTSTLEFLASTARSDALTRNSTSSLTLLATSMVASVISRTSVTMASMDSAAADTILGG